MLYCDRFAIILGRLRTVVKLVLALALLLIPMSAF